MVDKNSLQHSNNKGQESILLAQDENTDPEILRELAQAPDREIRQLIAANPNAPSDVLLKLGVDFPAELLANPVFSLLYLENPAFITEIPLNTLQNILRQENVPEYILEQAAEKADLETQLRLVANSQTSSKILQRLRESRHGEVVQATVLHVNLVGELTQKKYKQRSKEIIAQIINHKTSDTYLPDCYSIGVLAQICPIPESILQYLINESGNNHLSELCEKMARSPATLANTLKYLANHPNSPIRVVVAQNRNTPKDILRKLASDRQDSMFPRTVQSGVASNPNTPGEILESMVKKDIGVLIDFEIAKNPNTPITLLKQLANSNSKKVATSAIDNLKARQSDRDVVEILKDPKTPAAVLEKLAQQQKNISYVARHPNTPQNLLQQFARNPDEKIRCAVAENPNLPVNLLEELADDDSSTVRQQVAANLQTPVRVVFKQLARDRAVSRFIASQMTSKHGDYSEVGNILDLFAENSTSPLKTILRRLLFDGKMEARLFLAQRLDLPTEMLTHLASDPELKVRQAVAQNSNTPVDDLRKLSNDKDSKVRQSLAKNLHTPSETLERLAKDEDSSVRMTIACRTDLSSQVLEDLANDKNFQVRSRSMVNPSLAKESVERILCGQYMTEYLRIDPDFLLRNPDSLALVVNYYAQSKSRLTSYIALLQPQIDRELLAQKSSSVLWLERFAVAQNPQTSPETIERLAEDSNQLVRAAARIRLETNDRV